MRFADVQSEHRRYHFQFLSYPFQVASFPLFNEKGPRWHAASASLPSSRQYLGVANRSPDRCGAPSQFTRSNNQAVLARQRFINGYFYQVWHPDYRPRGINGLNAVSPLASMLTWSGTNFEGIANTTVSIANKKSYFLYIRGDRTKGVNNTVFNSSATTLRTNGTVYTGLQTFTVPPSQQYGLIANLYP